MIKTIEIIVSPQGETVVTTRGYVGSECREASKFLERTLGVQTKEQLTSEYYATQTTAQQQHLSGQGDHH
jgi:hypothetical protein